MSAINKRAVRADILLLLTACIWGFAFVAQRSGMDYVGPFTFNGIRFLLGSLSLLPFIALRRGSRRARPTPVKTVILFSCAAGACLFVAVSLQQLGLIYTTAGHSGFITGMYVALTPIFGIFLGRKTGVPTWIGVALCVSGMFCISAGGFGESGGAMLTGDILTAIGAVFWAFHVLLIDRLVHKVDALVLSSGQFAFCGIASSVVAFCLGETLSPDAIARGLAPLLYGSFVSVGIAYTLQVVAQKDAPPAHATIILSLEGVFAAIGGVILLAEPLHSWTLLGFALMLGGMLATQWDVIAGHSGIKTG
ncbi:MAG: DMT family transporter [Treponema sp.]|jgi:drug/metabolite transporter (DMT)-like permease|nr:DMT family transporter [Treponema sp.]